MLSNTRMHRLLREAWRSADNWLVGRYVIMPDHIHLFCAPGSAEYHTVTKWVAYWKRLVSMKVPNLKPLWQRGCWDTQIRNAHKYEDKWKYVMMDPVRKGMVSESEEWPFQGIMNDLIW